MIFGCSILTISTFPAHTFGWAFFLPHLMAEVNVSRSAVASMWGVALLVDAPLLILAGRFLDRYGQQLTLTLACPLFACFVCLGSTIDSWVGLMGSFFVLRFLGAGVIVLVSNTTLAKWFKVHRGKAALVVVVSSFVMVIMQAPVHFLIGLYGWRWAFIILAVIVFSMQLITLAIIRDDPVYYELLPDFGQLDRTDSIDLGGIEMREKPRNAEIVKVEAGCEELTLDGFDQLSYAECKKTALFWACIISQCSVEFSWCGFQFFIYDLLSSSGAKLSADDVVFVQVAGSIVTMVYTLLVGLIVDKIKAWHLRYVMLLSLFCGMVAQLFLAFGNSVAAMCLFTSFLGASMGPNDLLTSTLYAGIFGRKEISKKLSLVSTAAHFFVGLSPLYCGLTADLSGGSYSIAFWTMFAFSGTCAVALLFSPNPHQNVPK